MRLKNMECGDFVDVLASKNPVPGGGGASALVAAIGMALGNMVGSLTIGKKKYASVQDDVISLMQRAEKLRAEFLELIQGDVEAFEPLSKAYGMPSNTQEEKERKEIVMEECLVTTGSLPLLIMKKCCEGIDLTREFAEKGSALAISDAGCSASFLKAALEAAALNVFINTKYMKNRENAEKMEKQAEVMIREYGKKSEDIFNKVRSDLKTG